MSKSLLALALAALTTLPASADTQKNSPAIAKSEAAQKTADIKRWLALSGQVTIQMEAAKRTIPRIKMGSGTEIPEAFWVDFEKAISYEAYEAAIIPIYERNFSAQEIRDFLKVIENPAFKKFNDKDKLVQKEQIGVALKKFMEDNSKRLMQKHKPAGAKTDPKKN